MKPIRNFLSIILLLTLGVFAFTSCEKPKEEEKSDAKQIISFVFMSADNASFESDITATIEDKDLHASFPFGTDILSLIPTIEISEAATITPASGEAQDFTNGVEYLVTAEDGSAFKYTVTVLISAGSGEFIVSFVVDGNEAFINDSASTILGQVNYGNALDNVTPTITLAAGAVISPESGVAQDFTDSIEYTVSLGTETKTYWVTVVGTPVKGEYKEGHEDYTLANYWPKNIKRMWAVNRSNIINPAGDSIGGMVFTHEGVNPEIGYYSAGFNEDIEMVEGQPRTGQAWIPYREEQFLMDGNVMLWWNGWGDKWSMQIYKSFELEKAIFKNQAGLSFDITALNDGNHIPVMLENIYDETYSVKVWYNEVDMETGVKVKTYRDMQISGFEVFMTEILEDDDGQDANVERECIWQDLATWNENDGWIYGGGDMDGGEPNGENITYGYREYLAQGEGRGWLVYDNNNLTGENLVYKVHWLQRP